VHKLAGAKHSWGPLIIIPWQQFCHMHGTGLEHLKRSEFRKTVLEKGALWRAEYGAVKRDVRYNRLTFTGEMQHCADLRRQPWCLPSRIGLFLPCRKTPRMLDVGKTRGTKPFSSPLSPAAKGHLPHHSKVARRVSWYCYLLYNMVPLVTYNCLFWFDNLRHI
jgi:hypothetical protein